MVRLSYSLWLLNLWSLDSRVVSILEFGAINMIKFVNFSLLLSLVWYGLHILCGCRIYDRWTLESCRFSSLVPLIWLNLSISLLYWAWYGTAFIFFVVVESMIVWLSSRVDSSYIEVSSAESIYVDSYGMRYMKTEVNTNQLKCKTTRY